MNKGLTTIPCHPLYSVTGDGRVWSHRRNKWMNLCKNSRGYFLVNLYDLPRTGQHIGCLVQHLVLQTFVGPKPVGMECRHLNGIRTDNRLENLCWGTRSENQQDSIRHGTHGGAYSGTHPNSKLSNYDRRMILYMYSIGLFKRKELAEIYDVAEVTIKKQVEGYTYPNLNITHLGRISSGN